MKLYLYEEIMLLALRDDKGTLVTSYVEQAVAGAVFAELLLAGKVKVEEDKKKSVQLIESTPIGDPIIDECIAIIAAQSKSLSTQDLLAKFIDIKDLKHKVARRLCERQVLKVQEDKVLFVFTRTTYPELNPEPEQQILQRIRTAICDHQAEIDARTTVLIALAKSANLLSCNLDKSELKDNKQRIEQIVSGQLAGDATREAIAAYEAAVFIATIVPTIITTTIVVNS